jgi:hypothetical protein
MPSDAASASPRVSTSSSLAHRNTTIAAIVAYGRAVHTSRQPHQSRPTTCGATS